MTLGIAFIVVLLIAVGGRRRSRPAGPTGLRAGGRLHSCRPITRIHALIWVLAPALLVLAAWSPMQSRLVNQAVLATPEGKALPDFEMQRDTILAEARQIANREIEAGFNPEFDRARSTHRGSGEPLRLDRRNCRDPGCARQRGDHAAAASATGTFAHALRSSVG